MTTRYFYIALQAINRRFVVAERGYINITASGNMVLAVGDGRLTPAFLEGAKKQYAKSCTDKGFSFEADDVTITMMQQLDGVDLNYGLIKEPDGKCPNPACKSTDWVPEGMGACRCKCGAVWGV